MNRLESLLIDRVEDHPLPSRAEEDILVAALLGDDALRQALGRDPPTRSSRPFDGEEGGSPWRSSGISGQCSALA